jgi:hypothetical protein
MSSTDTVTETYSITDIEIVLRRVTADLIMIATSTGGWTEAKAREYAHDVELLAKKGYLKWFDVTLLVGGAEQKATRFEVNTESGQLVMSRPGGVLWPRLSNPYLRIVLGYTSAYTDDAREKLKSQLIIGWVPTTADTSHSQLTAGDGRDYASNGYGVQRKDFSK